ncbi:MAG: NADPH-dependent F420 reductase [Candidatus Limnocylindrales bacterium]
MNLAIIGAGNVGRSLAIASVRAGHAVVVASADLEDAEGVAQVAGARAVASNHAAVAAADVVILAIPTDKLVAVATDLRAALSGKIVIDVTNRPTPDASGNATSMAEELQAAIPESKVVKAFNTAFASRQVDPIVEGVALDGYVAADDPAARATVLELVRSIGFRPIDAGSLAVSRTLEGMAWLNISLQLQNGWPWQSGWKLVGPTAAAA